MSSRHSSIRTVHTATVTPAMRDARKYMSLAGISLLVFSVWLFVGLLSCSVDPELSTSATHVFGSVTHYLCSALIENLGLMSLSIALIFSRLGVIFWSAQLPKLTLRDLSIYLTFLLLTSTQLQITLETEMMGAPIGGFIGVKLSHLLTPLGPYGAQSFVCIGIFSVLGLQMWLTQKQKLRETPPATREMDFRGSSWCSTCKKSKSTSTTGS